MAATTDGRQIIVLSRRQDYPIICRMPSDLAGGLMAAFLKVFRCQEKSRDGGYRCGLKHFIALQVQLPAGKGEPAGLAPITITFEVFAVASGGQHRRNDNRRGIVDSAQGVDPGASRTMTPAAPSDRPGASASRGTRTEQRGSRKRNKTGDACREVVAPRYDL
jgi:hypothetical protein